MALHCFAKYLFSWKVVFEVRRRNLLLHDVLYRLCFCFFFCFLFRMIALLCPTAEFLWKDPPWWQVSAVFVVKSFSTRTWESWPFPFFWGGGGGDGLLTEVYVSLQLISCFTYVRFFFFSSFILFAFLLIFCSGMMYSWTLSTWRNDETYRIDQALFTGLEGCCDTQDVMWTIKLFGGALQRTSKGTQCCVKRRCKRFLLLLLFRQWKSN